MRCHSLDDIEQLAVDALTRAGIIIEVEASAGYRFDPK
jgi:hypothetical protein